MSEKELDMVRYRGRWFYPKALPAHARYLMVASLIIELVAILFVSAVVTAIRLAIRLVRFVVGLIVVAAVVILFLLLMVLFTGAVRIKEMIRPSS